MINLFKWVLGIKSPETKNYNITVGERDEDGFATVYKDGEPTQCRMLVFTQEESDKIKSVVDEID